MIEAQSPPKHKVLIDAFQKQIAWCDSLGSPFTARVLSVLVADLAAGGDTARMIGDWPGDPMIDALPLRCAGALHALVLSGVVPALAAVYPPTVDKGRLEPVLKAVLKTHTAFIRSFLGSPPQTNEVGRSGVLLGGFLEIAKVTQRPLRLLEIGGSAGLNLVWDLYSYRIGDSAWGDPSSPVLIAPEWTGGLPPMDADISVVAREGCDIAPIDLDDPAQRLRLRAYVWADQPDRLSRMEHAIGVARQAGHRVVQADAAVWVDAQLTRPSEGCATVLYHSIMWQYMPAETQRAIRRRLELTGETATPAAPLAWLRFEPPKAGAKAELRLTLWPGREDRVLATAQAHGKSVSWLAA